MEDMDFGGGVGHPPYVKMPPGSAISLAFLYTGPRFRYWQPDMSDQKADSESEAKRLGYNLTKHRHDCFVVAILDGATGGAGAFRDGESFCFGILDVKGKLWWALREAAPRCSEVFSITRTGSGKQTEYTISKSGKPVEQATFNDWEQTDWFEGS